MREPDLKAKLQLGLIVFGALVAIELIEYFVGTIMRSGSWPLLGILALVGAWPILYYFMHINQLWRPGGDPTGRNKVTGSQEQSKEE